MYEIGISMYLLARIYYFQDCFLQVMICIWWGIVVVVVSGRSLFHLTLHLFQEHDLINTFKLDIVKLMRCISKYATSIYLSACLSVCLSISIYLSIYPSIYLSFIQPFIYLSIHLSIHPSIYLSISIHRASYPYIYLHTQRYIHRYIHIKLGICVVG